MVIMSALHVSFSMLEIQQAYTANAMSLIGGGSMWVSGGSSLQD
jgi:hypothetical protein